MLVFFLVFIETLIDMRFFKYLVVEIDFAFDFRVQLDSVISGVLFVGRKFRLDLLIIALDCFVVVFKDSLFPEVFIFIYLFPAFL